MTGAIKVLIADDNRDFCSILRDFFSNNPDFELVDVCSNGLEVLEALNKKRRTSWFWTSLCPTWTASGYWKRWSI